eukprot:scaffold28621_cov144-Amphora_coffeaeformis.AAC.3
MAPVVASVITSHTRNPENLRRSLPVAILIETTRTPSLILMGVVRFCLIIEDYARQVFRLCLRKRQASKQFGGCGFPFIHHVHVNAVGA